MTKLNLSAEEPVKKDFTPFYGAFKGVTQNAKLEEKTDKNGNLFYGIELEIAYDDTNGETRTQKVFGNLPFDWGSDKPLGQLYDILGTDYKKLVANFEKETNGKDVCVKIGAQRHWQTNELRTYPDKNGVDRLSLGVTGFAAYNRVKSAWTPEDEAREVAAYEEFKQNTNATQPETQPGFTDETPAAQPVDDDNF